MQYLSGSFGCRSFAKPIQRAAPALLEWGRHPAKFSPRRSELCIELFLFRGQILGHSDISFRKTKEEYPNLPSLDLSRPHR